MENDFGEIIACSSCRKCGYGSEPSPKCGTTIREDTPIIPCGPCENGTYSDEKGLMPCKDCEMKKCLPHQLFEGECTGRTDTTRCIPDQCEPDYKMNSDKTACVEDIPNMPNTTTKPVINTTKPVINATKPVINPTKPVINATKPVINATKPVINPTKPVINATKPVINATKPVINPTKPVINTTKPVHSNTRTGLSTGGKLGITFAIISMLALGIGFGLYRYCKGNHEGSPMTHQGT